MQSPFSDPADHRSFQRWRDRKLAHYPRTVDELVVEIDDPRRLSSAEREALRTRCAKANMAVYHLRHDLRGPPLRDALREFGRQLGLERLDRGPGLERDGIVALSATPARREHEYIPYTDRPINWHTDGYYNPPGDQVRAVIMHCAVPGASGGANRLFDPEMAYLLLRERDPAYVAALARPDAMTVPANLQGERVLRPARRGPVFSCNPDDGTLHMRYTARSRSIVWSDRAPLPAAVETLETLLGTTPDHSFEVRLGPGEGIVCNNVLHTRAGFSDAPDQRRLLLRARYHERIAGTTCFT